MDIDPGIMNAFAEGFQNHEFNRLKGVTIKGSLYDGNALSFVESLVERTTSPNLRVVFQINSMTSDVLREVAHTIDGYDVELDMSGEDCSDAVRAYFRAECHGVIP